MPKRKPKAEVPLLLDGIASLSRRGSKHKCLDIAGKIIFGEAMFQKANKVLHGLAMFCVQELRVTHLDHAVADGFYV